MSMAKEAAYLRRERRARGQLRMRGYRLAKNPARTVEAINYGGYMIVETNTGTVVAGGHSVAYMLSLEQVEAFIREM